mgnify:CR=1 FL=1
MLDTKIYLYKVGDLVYYRPHTLIEDPPKKIIGVIIAIMPPVYKLFKNFPVGQQQPDFEYKVVWLSTGSQASVLGLNLKKLKNED